jgi:hypothetical protein
MISICAESRRIVPNRAELRRMASYRAESRQITPNCVETNRIAPRRVESRRIDDKKTVHRKMQTTSRQSLLLNLIHLIQF